MDNLYLEWFYIGFCFLAGLSLQIGDGSICPLLQIGDRWNRPLFVLAVVACIWGGYLRFAGISFGLPMQFHPDEIPKAQVITRMYEEGSLNPHYFLHPSLLLYATLITNIVLRWFGLEGSFYETAFYAGRFVSAAAGTLSIAVVYAIGRRLRDESTGAIAALFLACIPLHVTISRYMKEDALLILFLLLVFLFVLRAQQGAAKKDLILAGMCAGLACATKYTGLVSVLFFLVLPVPAYPQLFFWTLIGFLVATPYSVLSFSEFYEGFSKERAHALRGHTESISAWSQLWLYHWVRSIRPGVTDITAFLTVFLAGFLAAGRRWWMLLLITAIYYGIAEAIPSKPAPQAERYVSTCMPCIALLLAAGISELIAARKLLIASAIWIACMLSMVPRTLELFRNLSPDTRELASLWIEQHIPTGSAFVMDFQPYSPVLPANRYTMLNDPYLPVGAYIDIKKLQSMGAHYLVLSSLAYDRFFSQPNQEVVERVKYRTVFSRLQLMQEFQNPAGRYGFHNPVIRIYKVP